MATVLLLIVWAVVMVHLRHRSHHPLTPHQRALRSIRR